MCGLASLRQFGQNGDVKMPAQAVEVQSELGIAEPEVRTRSKSTVAGERWLCAWCLNPVAHAQDEFSCEGKREFVFENPDGISFHIVLFSETIGCVAAGVPTLQHTWFAGHAWSYCLCDRCRTHLGWFYSGPSDFVGLIRARIVQASLVGN